MVAAASLAAQPHAFEIATFAILALSSLLAGRTVPFFIVLVKRRSTAARPAIRRPSCFRAYMPSHTSEEGGMSGIAASPSVEVQHVIGAGKMAF